MMNRRNFMVKAGTFGALGVAAGMLPLLARAEDRPVPGPSPVPSPSPSPVQEPARFDITIARNHGHALTLAIIPVLKAFQAARRGQTTEFSIQGGSGHAHAIAPTFDELTRLLADGTVELNSSLGAGHSHGVTVQLTLSEPA